MQASHWGLEILGDHIKMTQSKEAMQSPIMLFKTRELVTNQHTQNVLKKGSKIKILLGPKVLLTVFSDSGVHSSNVNAPLPKLGSSEPGTTEWKGPGIALGPAGNAHKKKESHEWQIKHPLRFFLNHRLYHFTLKEGLYPLPSPQSIKDCNQPRRQPKGLRDLSSSSSSSSSFFYRQFKVTNSLCKHIVIPVIKLYLVCNKS